MRRLKLALTLLAAASVSVSAQDGVFDIHPASGEGKPVLTVKDMVSNRKVYPEVKRYGWDEDGTLKELKKVPESAGICFQKEGNLYFIEGKDTLLIAESPEPGIVFGTTVSRNEFGIEGGIFLSPDSSKVAFYRKDERAVTDFPLLDIRTRTGTLLTAKYPMAGMTSERLALGIWDRASRRTVWADVTDFTEERYLAGVCFSPDSKNVFIQVLDRPQHEMHLNMYRTSDGSLARTVLTERNDAWVEPQDPLYFIEGRSEFLYRTDNRDGWKSLYLCDTLGAARRITEAPADVEYVGNDGRFVYYYSAEVSPVERHLFRREMKWKKKSTAASVALGAPQRLTLERGWHTVSMSPGYDSFLDTWSSFNVPGRGALKKADGSLVRTLYEAPNPLGGYAQCEVDFGTVPSADGKFENYYRLFKPAGFDPTKKYPLIVYVYGGPHSQMVKDSWLGGIRLWEMIMASRGYLVYVQDNRGTSWRGAEFEKAINRRCGQAEMEDQIAGLRELMKQPWVDCSRIGVHGWSYGGFMTISLMTNYPEIFKVGVAGGPVIDWKWYEVMYGERYMDTPETNPEGYAATSLVEKVSNLNGRLLICQGAVDKTVVWQHSLNFTQKCIESGKPLDYFPYPLTEHNVRGKWRIHLYDKITDYFETWL